MEQVPCLGNKPGILLEAKGFQRWMAVNNDKDFKVVVL